MDEERLPLDPLDPTATAAGFNAVVRRLVIAAEPLLRARRVRGQLLRQIDRWRGPMLAAAAAIAVIALTALFRNGRPAPNATLAAGREASFASWVESGEQPEFEALLTFGLEE